MPYMTPPDGYFFCTNKGVCKSKGSLPKTIESPTPGICSSCYKLAQVDLTAATTVETRRFSLWNPFKNLLRSPPSYSEAASGRDG